MLHEQKFFFLASWAIAFALSCFYGRSLLIGQLTNVINTTVLPRGQKMGVRSMAAKSAPSVASHGAVGAVGNGERGVWVRTVTAVLSVSERPGL